MDYHFDDDIEKSLIKETEKKYATDLRKRLFYFAVESLKFLMSLSSKRELDVVVIQLSKSATSIGANFEEAQSSSDEEFVQKLRIALREANESNYWYRIIAELKISDKTSVQKLLNESKEITLILGSIVSKLDKKIKSH